MNHPPEFKPGILVHRRRYGNILALETTAGRVLLAANSKLWGALQRGGILARSGR
jgi:hypothetical protein